MFLVCQLPCLTHIRVGGPGQLDLLSAADLEKYASYKSAFFLHKTLLKGEREEE